MILVTGATGLIGTHLLWDLCKKGKKVKAIYRKSKRIESLAKVAGWYNSTDSEWFKKIEWVQVDMLDSYALKDVLVGVTQVYNCAAIVSFDPAKSEEVINRNRAIVSDLVNLCLDIPDLRLCHVSSVAALSRSEAGTTINEKSVWKQSRNNSAYAISKFESEREVWQGFAEGLNGFIVNPAMVLGPGNWGESSTELFAKTWKGMKYYTKGVNAYIDVRDVVDIMVKLMDMDVNESRYILSSENVSFEFLFQEMAINLGKKAPSKHAKPWMAELIWRLEWVRNKLTGSTPLVNRNTARTAVNNYYYSNDKIAKLLNWSFIPVKDSIKWSADCFLNDLKAKS